MRDFFGCVGIEWSDGRWWAISAALDGWEEGLSFLWKPSSLCWMAGRKVEFPVVKVRAGASSLCWMADWCVKVL